MKEITIIIFIILIIFFGEIYIYKFLDTTTNSILGDLNNLKNDIQKENAEKKELQNKAERIYSKWNIINEKWSNVILHEEIDSIETSLIRAKAKIENDYLKESIEDIETAIFLVNHIREKEKTTLKNIF